LWESEFREKGLRMRTFASLIILAVFTAGCTSGPQVAIDPRSITDTAKYESDLAECTSIAKNYDMSSSAIKNAAVGATAGGVAVAGIATAVAGAVFAPAIPFIVAGSALGGTALGGGAKMKENNARESILAECMKDRGYKAYSSK
jgi:hypothetical protein